MAPSNIEPQLGPHPSYITVANPYVFQQQLQWSLVSIGSNPSREDNFRLSGVQWINEIRTALQLPVRTFSTAVCYFHKFRLVHRDNEYQFQDAAAAALLAAAKIEDTLKKSREVLCAAYNVKVPPAEHISSDDASFDLPAKAVIGLERLMLEASGFDFRVRYPHKHLIKLAKEASIDKDVSKVAYDIMIDLYKTFGPLKQTCATMAFACIELATLIMERQQGNIRSQDSTLYKKWRTTRTEIMETLLDLLDLYTHFQKSSIVGPLYNIDKFIQLRIRLNQEIEEDATLTRYTEQHEAPRINGFKSNIRTPKTPVTPASPSDTRVNGKDIVSPATMSPRSSGSGRKNIGARGQDGTIRFMLDAEQARQEKDTVAEYFKVEYEDYEVEFEEPIKPDPPKHHPNPRTHHNHRNGRDDRFNHHNKRMRRMN